ncbi:MAG: hypothetical protein ETSY1_32070 [Candidatus Entotheonella factor]|uniref:Phage-shock protein n=1 Tax=Entotheonella factor TaxID=1429438 RepID=W4LBH0_ENTF1|nr:PspA/IM30 family protein [Candidatus Entotheonella palauensis]ETW95090.1 MAG: hypothetical protein ETSY1_32070 [Candidatus Entotheonella factor]
MSNVFKRISEVLTTTTYVSHVPPSYHSPEAAAGQLIHELVCHIRTAREGVLNAIAGEKKLRKDLDAQRHQAAEWERRAENALRAGREESARIALGRKKEHDQIIAKLEPAWEAARRTSEQLKAQLRSLEAKLGHVRHQRSTFAARQRAAHASSQLERTLMHFRDGLDTDTALASMEDRLSEIEARSEALAELNDETSSVEREFQQVEVDTMIEDELTELKKRLDQEANSD